MNISYVKASDIQAEVSMLMNDVGKSRWTQAMLDAAYNMSVSLWQQRQTIPIILNSYNSDFTSQWSAGTVVYELPFGVQGGGVRPQYRRTPFMGTGVPVVGSALDNWIDFVSYTIEPPTSEVGPFDTGRWQIRFNQTPYTAEARLVVNINNTRIPQASTTVIHAVGDGAEHDVFITPTWTGDAQGFVVIESEVMSYCGFLANSGLLTNVVRGLNGAITAHNIGAAVNVVFAFEESGDRAGFVDTMMGICHRMYLNNASQSDNSFHQQMVTYYDNRVQAFWRTRPVRRGTRARLTEFSMVH